MVCWFLSLSLLSLALACGKIVSLGPWGSADFIWEVLALYAKVSLTFSLFTELQGRLSSLHPACILAPLPSV